MGRVRKFTQETYEALQAGAEDNDGEWLGVKDFFYDISLHMDDYFGTLELKYEMSCFNSYLEDVADLNDYTAKEIDDIFREVINVDEYYAGLIEGVNEQMKNYDKVVRQLKDCIGDSGFETNFSKDSFLKELPEATKLLAGVRWRSILSKDVEDITEEEFNIVAEYLIQSGDAELLEEMLSYCYTFVEPGKGGGNPLLYQDGAVGTVRKYCYRMNDKYKELAAAVGRVTTVWMAVSYELKEDDDELWQWVTTGMQYNAFLAELGQNTELAVVEELLNDKTTKCLNEKLIDIKWNTDSSISATYYPYIGRPLSLEEEMSYRIIMTTSAAYYNQAGQAALTEQGFKYIKSYTGYGHSVCGTMAENGINQIISMLMGKIPGTSILSSIRGVMESGVRTCETNNVVLKSENIANMGWMVDEFGLFCVIHDINDDSYQCSVRLYPGPDTQRTVDAFNTYMGQDENEAQYVGYPPEGLTVEYLLDVQNAEEVYEMLNNIKTRKEDVPLIYEHIEELKKGD